ncbi:Outer membrane efflux protein precursor [Croceitalea dokdonensis DOKDO 023]|uniref:Outer membrane efflux protein n=1 Tax=Croceitalea dokdonensis DOKDO 023 TaxID=1300341 RepID=A0A0P7AU65_9FLAO|nr:TolC family protein [Croceitalea dokdonensis]KPM32008.1 Outer membrane efflux protein precursor [Croceitalea dokdonensis DOKDO 023]
MRLHLIVLLLIAPFFITAQEQPTAFTLEDAVNYALKHNYSAINADRDILDAQKQKWEVIASGLPQITGAVGYQNQIIQPIAQFPSILVPPEFLPEGVVQDPDTFIPIVFGPPQTATASATLRQQIFDGSYIVGVQATKSFLSYSQNNKEKTALEVRKAVVEAYGNVLLARESVAIFQKNKTNLEKNLVETQKIFENGLGDEESVDQLQITLASVDNQLKNAIRLEKITLQMLNLMMGLDTENPTTLLDNLTSLTEQNMDSNFLTQAFQIENNIDYKLALNLNEQRFYELKLAKSRALPTLNGFLSYGANSFSDRFNFLSPGQQWFEQSILGLDLSIPIFSSLGRSASTQRAKIALEKAKTQLTEAEQQIRLQLDRAKSDYTFSIEQYQTSKENLALAERIETKNEIKYNEGLATSFELRQAQTQLYNSQQEYLQSMVDVINRRTQLEVILNQ